QRFRKDWERLTRIADKIECEAPERVARASALPSWSIRRAGRTHASMVATSGCPHGVDGFPGRERGRHVPRLRATRCPSRRRLRCLDGGYERWPDLRAAGGRGQLAV